MAKYEVEFKHIEEITYTGWVEADSEEEALEMVQNEPFDINDLQDGNHQGIDLVDIYVEEVDE